MQRLISLLIPKGVRSSSRCPANPTLEFHNLRVEPQTCLFNGRFTPLGYSGQCEPDKKF